MFASRPTENQQRLAFSFDIKDDTVAYAPVATKDPDEEEDNDSESATMMGSRVLYWLVILLVVLLVVALLISLILSIVWMSQTPKPLNDALLRQMAYQVDHLGAKKVDVVVQVTYGDDLPGTDDQPNQTKLLAALEKVLKNPATPLTANDTWNVLAQRVADELDLKGVRGVSGEIFVEDENQNMTAATCTKGVAPRLMKTDAV